MKKKDAAGLDSDSAELYSVHEDEREPEQAIMWEERCTKHPKAPLRKFKKRLGHEW